MWIRQYNFVKPKKDAEDNVDHKSEILARIKHHVWESYGFVFSQGKNFWNVLMCCKEISLLETKIIEINTKWISSIPPKYDPLKIENTNTKYKQKYIYENETSMPVSSQGRETRQIA